MKRLSPALGVRAMGFQEVPDDAVKHFLLPVRERHVKQVSVQMVHALQSGRDGRLSPSRAGVVHKTLQSGKATGGPCPKYRRFFSLSGGGFPVHAGGNGKRLSENSRRFFLPARARNARRGRFHRGECLPGVPDCFSRGTPGAEICRRWAGRGFYPAETCRRTAFAATVKSLAPRSEASRRCLRKAALHEIVAVNETQIAPGSAPHAQISARRKTPPFFCSK